jgi:hypothetical protein
MFYDSSVCTGYTFTIFHRDKSILYELWKTTMEMYTVFVLAKINKTHWTVILVYYMHQLNNLLIKTFQYPLTKLDDHITVQ